jgi:DNA repair protein RAD5
MGKTIQIASLLHQHRHFLHKDVEATSDTQVQSAGSAQKQTKLSSTIDLDRSTTQSTSRLRATLIVAPASLLYQWEQELQRCSKEGIMKTLVWHGQSRGDLDELFDTGMDVEGDEGSIQAVITSYGVLGSEWSKHFKARVNSESPIFSSEILSYHGKALLRCLIVAEWLRVVIDEAHHCKSRTTLAAKAVYALRSQFRWAVTGSLHPVLLMLLLQDVSPRYPNCKQA